MLSTWSVSRSTVFWPKSVMESLISVPKFFFLEFCEGVVSTIVNIRFFMILQVFKMQGLPSYIVAFTVSVFEFTVFILAVVVKYFVVVELFSFFVSVKFKLLVIDVGKVVVKIRFRFFFRFRLFLRFPLFSCILASVAAWRRIRFNMSPAKSLLVLLSEDKEWSLKGTPAKCSIFTAI